MISGKKRKRKMGGPRSGTWYRWNTVTTLNDRIAVDVRDWQRRELLVPGRHFSWAWSADGDVKDSIQVRVKHDRVTLVYKQRRPGDDWRSVEEQITLTSTPCHFGGRRVWFVCPRCHDRAAKLYSSTPYFLCRDCCGLPYASQNESDHDRALRRARNLRRRLGAGLVVGDPIWDKPKGMNWRTFDRLKEEAERADEMADIYFVAGGLRIIGQCLPR